MTKLTKTEKKTLKVAAESPRGAVQVTDQDGHTSRAMLSLRSLIQKGFLVTTNYYTEHETRKGRTTLFSIVVATITDEGRQALEPQA